MNTRKDFSFRGSNMNNILTISKEEFLNKLEVKEGYVYDQVMNFIANGKQYSEMTNVSKTVREKLIAEIDWIPVKIIKIQTSKDGTKKYLFQLIDGNLIEAVYMKNSYGNTICLSTQVGCRMGCKFCASTIGGKIRDLHYSEMIAQVIMLNKDNGGDTKNRTIKNIVLMGIGEPLDNYENVIRFIREITESKFYLSFSKRSISISTCGLVDKIKMLMNENMPINLCISLHAPIDEVRTQIMPINNKYSVDQIIDVCREYYKKTKRQIIFEYVMIQGVNDTKECCEEIIKISKLLDCHFNFITLNKVKESKFVGSSKGYVYNFVQRLNEKGVNATVRRSLGSDIDGACGQLRRNVMEHK